MLQRADLTFFGKRNFNERFLHQQIFKEGVKLLMEASAASFLL
jgi:hypothetical protein